MSILYVNACVREQSRTKELTNHLLAKLDGEIEEINLNEEKLLPWNRERLNMRDSLIKNQDFGHDLFKYARQFANAETIVFSVPCWDMSFSALLKIYIENINILGITFKYSEEGFPVSLCKANKIYYVTTTGSPMLIEDFGYEYVKALGKVFYGVDNVQLIKAEGLDLYGANVAEILAQAKANIDNMSL